MSAIPRFPGAVPASSYPTPIAGIEENEDSRRECDDGDPLHGERAAEFVREIHGRWFVLDRNELRLLEQACRDHSEGRTRADPSVQTCWDADRLDLGRVGIRPDPAYLCTDAAREPERIASAWRRSLARE